MRLDLILVIITFLVGVMVILFTSPIGVWWFRIYTEIRKGLPDSLSTITLGPFTSPMFFIWLLRIIGLGFAGGSVFILCLILFTQ